MNDIRLFALTDHNVLWLDVSVHVASIVHELQPLYRLNRQL